MNVEYCTPVRKKSQDALLERLGDFGIFAAFALAFAFAFARFGMLEPLPNTEKLRKFFRQPGWHDIHSSERALLPPAPKE